MLLELCLLAGARFQLPTVLHLRELRPLSNVSLDPCMVRFKTQTSCDLGRQGRFTHYAETDVCVAHPSFLNHKSLRFTPVGSPGPEPSLGFTTISPSGRLNKSYFEPSCLG